MLQDTIWTRTHMTKVKYISKIIRLIIQGQRDRTKIGIIYVLDPLSYGNFDVVVMRIRFSVNCAKFTFVSSAFA